MAAAEREKWNAIYADKAAADVKAAWVLQQHRWLLPAGGRALDLACGRGGNALLMAAQGLETEAWDISDTAIRQLQQRAAHSGLRLTAEQRDVTARPPAGNSFDVIVISRFLERQLLPVLPAALRPSGLLFYQSFVKEKTRQVGPSNPDYLLGPNELLRAFADLHLIYYLEAGTTGNPAEGQRNEAMLIAQRRD